VKHTRRVAMAFYTLATVLCTLAQSEMYMHLYINQVYGGANPNQAVLINMGGFGTTAITDWPITDGQALGATVVGRAQGIHSLSSKTSNSWYTSMNLVFEDSRYDILITQQQRVRSFFLNHQQTLLQNSISYN
jgi:hypothetical protein